MRKIACTAAAVAALLPLAGCGSATEPDEMRAGNAYVIVAHIEIISLGERALALARGQIIPAQR